MQHGLSPLVPDSLPNEGRSVEAVLWLKQMTTHPYLSHLLAAVGALLIVGSFLALPLVGPFVVGRVPESRTLAGFSGLYVIIVLGVICLGISRTKIRCRTAVGLLAVVTLAFTVANITVRDVSWHKAEKGSWAWSTGWHAAYGFPFKVHYDYLGDNPDAPTESPRFFVPLRPESTAPIFVLSNALIALCTWLVVLAVWEMAERRKSATTRASNHG